MIKLIQKYGGGKTMKKITDEEKKELKYFSGKSYLGLLELMAMIGAVLGIIALFCPFFSYNPTIVDEFKRTIAFDELPYAVFGFLPFILAVILSVFNPTLAIRDSVGDGRGKGNKLLALAGAEVVLAIVSLVIIELSSVWYEIPEEEFWYLRPTDDVGASMYIAAVCIFCACTLLYAVLGKLVLCGKLDKEQMLLNKPSGE